MNPFEGYDIIVGVDVSASMGSPSVRSPGITRFQEVSELALGIATQAAQFDADGIDVITFGQGAVIHKGVTPDKIGEIFAAGATHYKTDLDAAIALADQRQAETGKNTIFIVFTDGEPTNKTLVETAVVKAANRINEDNNLTIGLVQVGDDARAAAFLAKLDDEIKAKFDIVDAISATEAANLNVVEMLTKFIND